MSAKKERKKRRCWCKKHKNKEKCEGSVSPMRKKKEKEKSIEVLEEKVKQVKKVSILHGN